MDVTIKSFETVEELDTAYAQAKQALTDILEQVHTEYTYEHDKENEVLWRKATSIINTWLNQVVFSECDAVYKKGRRKLQYLERIMTRIDNKIAKFKHF